MKKLPLLMLASMLTVLPALAIEENVPIPLGTAMPPQPTAAPALHTVLPYPDENGATPLPTVHPYLTESTREGATPLPVAQPTPMPRAASIGSEYSPAAMQALYADISEGQSPSLTADEKQRLFAVFHRYEQGERPTQTIPDLAENVCLGMYTLNPEDYDGDKAYALLPERALTDDELLQIVDAFVQLGVPFGDDTLSYRNCARGGGSEASRPLTNEEAARASTLHRLYRRQELRPKTPFTALPGDDGIGEIRLNPEGYRGLDSFAFLPYRPMTDEELLRRVDHDSADEKSISMQQYAEFERKAREQLAALLDAPLSMDLTHEEITSTRNQACFLPEATAYSAHFRLPGGDEDVYSALLDVETGKVLWVLIYAGSSNGQPNTGLRLDPFDAKWQRIAENYVNSIRRDGARIKAVLPKGEIAAPDAGCGAFIHVQMEDGGEYHLTIPYQTAQVSPAVGYLGQPPLPDPNVSQ